MKKLLGLMMAAAMVLCFAGCGGSGGDATDEGASASEPNAGIKGIVFTMPDGWELEGMNEESYAYFSNPDSGLEIGVSTMDQEMIDEMGEDAGAKTIQEYYEKFFTYTDENLKEIDADAETTEVCGTEAHVLKVKCGDKGYVDIGTGWMMDDVVYDLYITNPDAYGDDGQLKEDAEALSDEDIALYESILASVQPGDGAAFLADNVNVDSVGDVSFETPEGYKVAGSDPNYVNLEKEGSDITLNIYVTKEDGLEYTMDENGEPYGSVKEYFESNLYEGVEKTEIAGYDGFINISPYDNDTYYFCDAGFLTDDGFYRIDFSSDAFDENGDVKEGATELSEDDIATFKSFVESIQKK